MRSDIPSQNLQAEKCPDYPHPVNTCGQRETLGETSIADWQLKGCERTQAKGYYEPPSLAEQAEKVAAHFEEFIKLIRSGAVSI